MAEVFLARVEGPMGFEKTLVLKRILPHLAEDPAFVGMFFTEARVAAQLNHPHIVQIFDFGQAEGTYYLAMEYIDGPDLRTLSAKAVQAGISLPPAFCAKIASAACEGLAFAHDFVDPSTGKHLELIHRDISPDNILLSRQGAVKVVDFGIAKATNQRHKTKTGTIKGKIAYMPLEQLQGQPLDRRADVYALGVVLYELLTGNYPFEATTDVSMMQAILFEPLVPAKSRRTDLPEALVQILDKALSKVREQRYPDCLTFQADLERFIVSTGQSVGARDLAQWVERLVPKNSAPARSAATGQGEDAGLAATAISQRVPAVGTGQQTMAAPLDAEVRPATGQLGAARTQSIGVDSAAPPPETRLESTRISQTQLPPTPEPQRTAARQVTGSQKAVAPTQAAFPQQAAAPAQTDLPEEDAVPHVQRRRLGLGVAMGGLVLLAAGGAVLHFRSGTGPQPIAPPPAPMTAAPTPPPRTPPPPATEVAARPTEAPPQPAAEHPEPVAAPTPPEPAAHAEQPPAEPTKPEPAETPAVRRKVAQKGTLEFRIRPYATVFLDGTALGQTPLKSQQVSAGTHKVRLLNPELNKDLVKTVEVKPGQTNVFKLDLNAD
ncbi:protein kinase domain-containing protein [Archangium sp.]|uniref:protein kinase domain-containing protein n=1 Tax=Archangium sp. TaxID=1872627 RepID=UPI003899AC4E